ncbi:MAG: hypothetical protein M3N18_10375 [Actinomycetota bacterium]|nr:hypothetical protein [Actinomycetota bacterium]
MHLVEVVACRFQRMGRDEETRAGLGGELEGSMTTPPLGSLITAARIQFPL